MAKPFVEYCVSFLSRLPLGALYALGDGIVYPLTYYAIRYRRSVTRRNLTNAFPDKSIQEIEQLERRFYHHFTDTIMEIIYGYHISDEEIEERFQFENVEEVERMARETGGVIYMLGHIGNWEWIADLARRYEDKSIINHNVYRRLKSKDMDTLMLHLRAKRGGGECIDKNVLLRHLVKMRHETHPITLGLISDQKPNPRSSHVWLDFLHQDTAFLDGGEVLSSKFGYAVFYAYITSPQRGYYQARFIRIDNNSTDSTSEQGSISSISGTITRKFASYLEQNILQQPELWLWSHNRWKWKRNNNA